MLLAAIGGEVITVPYSGGSESAKNVIAGEVTFMWASYSDVIDYLKSGDLKCIGTVDQKPIKMTIIVRKSFFITFYVSLLLFDSVWGCKGTNK